MMILKPKKVKDLKYRVWIRGNRCMICGAYDTTGHHLPNPEHGKRRNRDDLQVPLCFKCHRLMHDKPDEERKLLSMFYRIASQLWGEYK